MIGQDRLKKSIEKHAPDVDFLHWQNEMQIGSPSHMANPYAFKTFAFKMAFQMGYEHVMWLDASCVLMRDIAPIWDKIDSQGYIMQEAGHLCSTWCNDQSLKYFGITRDKASHFPMYGNAGFLGLNIYDVNAMDFFNTWHEASQKGVFVGSWDNKNNSESTDTRCKGHRHDMSCGSIIANQKKFKMESGNDWLNYAPPTQEPKENVYIHAQGV